MFSTTEIVQVLRHNFVDYGQRKWMYTKHWQNFLQDRFKGEELARLTPIPEVLLRELYDADFITWWLRRRVEGYMSFGHEKLTVANHAAPGNITLDISEAWLDEHLPLTW